MKNQEHINSSQEEKKKIDRNYFQDNLCVRISRQKFYACCYNSAQ